MNIFLIGSMGVGKSSLGRMMANNLQVNFVDTDEEIVAEECRTINGIFKNEGEMYFRQLEAKIIRGFDVTKNILIATGGGLPIYHDNMEYMLQTGLVIFLHDDIDVLTQRLFKGRAKRPAIKSLNISEIRTKLNQMLEQRLPIYEEAHIKFYRSEHKSEDALQLSKYLNIFL